MASSPRRRGRPEDAGQMISSNEQVYQWRTVSSAQVTKTDGVPQECLCRRHQILKHEEERDQGKAQLVVGLLFDCHVVQQIYYKSKQV